MYTWTTPPDLCPHMAITEALPTVEPSKPRCLGKRITIEIKCKALQFTVTTQLLPCNLCVFKACKEHSSIKTEVNQSFLVSVCYAMTTIHTFSLTFTMHFK